MKREKLIGASFSFQQFAFRWAAEHLGEIVLRRTEPWGIAPAFDQVEEL
ncbi:hypothetical protein [Rhizobium subbaraonis]|nr:hypothetical protein [Rhizobium subbaraonis]